MLSEEQIQKLLSENEYLQVQLADLNETLEIRNEQVDVLRNKNRKMTEMQSTLDNNLEEFSYMQHFIGKQQQKEKKCLKQSEEIESELIETIEMEKQYYTIREQFNSSNAALADVNSQLDEIPALTRELASEKRKVSELESNLDILKEENDLLRYEIAKLKKQVSTLKEPPGHSTDSSLQV